MSTKISALPSAGSIASTDILAVVTGGITKAVTAAAIVVAGLTWANDLAGSTNTSQKVVQLTGSAGVVGLPIGNKLTSTGTNNVGDVLTTVAGPSGVMAFGNSAITNLAVKLVANASGSYQQTVATTIYADSNTQWVRDVNGTGFALWDLSAQALKLDAATGTFPAIGLIRTKNYASSTVLWGGRTSIDGPILTQASTVLTLGDTTAWDLVVRGSSLTLQSASGSVVFNAPSYTFATFAGNTNLTLTPTAAAGSPTLSWAANITPTYKQADQTAASTNGANTTYQAQNATGVTSDGGSNQFVGGTGTSVYGKAAIYQGAVDFGRADVPFPNSAVTLNAAQSTVNILRLTANGIAGNQNLTITRRAAAPGQVKILNSTGFQITVFWLTGTGLAIANGAEVWVGSDGTNAIRV